MASSDQRSSETTDLELSLTRVGDRFELTMRLSRPGDAADLRRGSFVVTINTAIVNALKYDPAVCGAALRDALFGDPDARTTFAEARAASLDAGRCLRTRLLLPPELQPLPWEMLLDPCSDRQLALESNLLLTRYLDANDYQPVALRSRSQLRALVVVAAPTLAGYSLAPINAPAEIARIRAALQAIPVDTLGSDGDHCTLSALDKRLRDGEGYDIVYLIAHGTFLDSVPRLYLADTHGAVSLTDGSDLADLLRSLNERRPRLVALASCESAGDGLADTLAALGPLLARAGVPAVLAMQGQVSIATIERFAPVFFCELLRDGLVDRALAVARLAVRAHSDWWMPVLYMRLREGRLSQEIHNHGPLPTPAPPEPDAEQVLLAYLRRLRHDLAETDVVPIIGAYARADTRTYVPLQVRADPVAEPVFAALTSARAAPRPAGLLLCGEAGSGKSHTLRYTALALAQAWPGLAPELGTELGLSLTTPLLPVYVQLQDLPRCREELRRDEPTAEPGILRLIDHHLRRLTTDDESLPPSLIRTLAAGHACLFLLDGLDEIDDDLERQDLQGALVRFLCERPEHVYVVTSRPQEDLSLRPSGFAERQLLPLQHPQMRRILCHWYRVGYGTAPRTSEIEHQIEQQADDLLKRILNDPDFAPMASNPLFLTAMARMDQSDLRLPRLRVQKYDTLVDLLLKWRRNRLRLEKRVSLFDQVSPYAALDQLAKLAFCMLNLERDELTLEAFVRGACREILPDNRDADEATFDTLAELLGSVVRHTGLMTERRGRYRFTFGFRDYLAARAITRFADLDVRLFNRRTDPGWRTTIMLAVGHQATNDPRRLKPFFARLLADGVESTVLAAETLCETLADGWVSELDSERRQVLARLRELDTNPELIRRLEIADSR